MISLRLEKFLNLVWNLYQNFYMVTALVLGIPMFSILILHLDKKGAKNINVVWVLTWPLDDAGGFQLEFGISVLVWIWLLIFDTPMFSILILKVPRTCMSFKSWLGLWRMLEVPNSVGILILTWIWSLIFDTPMFSILILKVQKTLMSSNSLFGAVEDTGGCWPGFVILILIWIWSLVF